MERGTLHSLHEQYFDQLTMTQKMTWALVVEKGVGTLNNSQYSGLRSTGRLCSNSTYKVTPGLKPFTRYAFC